MKIRKVLFILLVIVFVCGNHAQKGKTPINEVKNSLLDLPVKDVRIQGENIHLILSEIAYKYNVPIGLEVSSNDDLLKDNRIEVDVKDGTIKDLLNSVVRQRTLYIWEVRDNVINVFPKENNRDLSLKSLLESKFKKFLIKKGTSRFGLREAITKSLELKDLLDKNNIIIENEVFTSRDIAMLGREFSIERSDVSLKSLLNEVIKDSQTKYWIINRLGENRQYLLLNL